MRGGVGFYTDIFTLLTRGRTSARVYIYREIPEFAENMRGFSVFRGRPGGPTVVHGGPAADVSATARGRYARTGAAATVD